MLTLSLIVSVMATASPCPHPYLPLEEGLALTYRAGKSQFTARYDDARSEGATARAKLKVTAASGRSGETDALCDGTGVSTAAGGLGVLALQSAGLEVKVTGSEGVLLVPMDELKPGKSWTNRVAVELSPPASAKLPGGLKAIIRTQFTSEATFDGIEEVTTPAGKFQALRLKTKTTATAGSTGAERSIDSIVWFAENVGLVKVLTGDHVDLELVELKRTRPVRKAEK